MLLALWADFFDPAAWVQPPPPPVPPPPPGSGGGWRNFDEYQRSNSDYWEERERMLKRFSPLHARKAVEERFPEVTELVSKRNDIASRIPEMPNLQALSDLGEMIDALDLQIKNYSIKCEEEALLALLL